MIKNSFLLIALIAFGGLSACGQKNNHAHHEHDGHTHEHAHEEKAASQNQEVNVYSYRKEALIKPVLDKFTESTGIKVNLISSKADALLQRIISEGENTPADVLISSDAGRLHRAKEAGVLQPFESMILTTNVPEHLRDPESYWVALSKRARVIFYNKGRVNPDDLSSYADLADPKWKGKICIRSSNNIYNQSLLASIIAHAGEEQAEKWAKGVVANFARDPKGNDRDQMKGAAIGVCDIAIANTYYFGRWLSSEKAEDKANAEKIAVFYPNQSDRGTHVNVSGAGITKYSKNKANALKLIEFLASEEAQQFYASVNHEYPVLNSVAPSDLVKSWGYPFKADNLNLEKLGKNNTQAVKIFDKAGWK